MDAAEEFLYHLRKLEALLERDYDTAGKNMQGGFIAPYRRALAKEMEQLQEVIRSLINKIS